MITATMSAVHRVFRYRLYPNITQHRTMKEWLGVCCELYNAALEERREAWKCDVSVSYFAQCRSLTEIRRDLPQVKAVPVAVAQSALKRVSLAFQAFFRRCAASEKPGYPRFRSRHRYRSFSILQPEIFHVKDKNLVLPKLGSIRISLHRPLLGTPQTVTVKVTPTGKWYASIACTGVPAKKYQEPTEGAIGIDLGLESLATLSTGEQIENPRWLRAVETKLIEAQVQMSRKKKDSRSWHRCRRRIARLYEKTNNQRHDHHHKLSRKLVERFAFLAVENLNVAGMARGLRTLRKSIHDASWASLLHKLSYKAEEAGRELVAVDPRGTTQECSQCGEVVPKALSDRLHSCGCGLTIDRDLNAARNILQRGLALSGGLAV